MSNTLKWKTNEILTLTKSSVLLAGLPRIDGLFGWMVYLTALNKQSSIILLHQLFLSYKLKKSLAFMVDDKPPIFSMKKSYYVDIKEHQRKGGVVCWGGLRLLKLWSFSHQLKLIFVESEFSLRIILPGELEHSAWIVSSASELYLTNETLNLAHSETDHMHLNHWHWTRFED